jgi:RNase P subunit RPR2
MVMKNDGRVSKKDRKKVHKKYRDITCANCGSKIDVTEKMKIGDYDRVGNSEDYVFFCDCCGVSTDIQKL